MPQVLADSPVPPERASERTPRTGIDFGLLVLGRLDEAERKGVEQASIEQLQSLEDRFPQFEWRLSV